MNLGLTTLSAFLTTRGLRCGCGTTVTDLSLLKTTGSSSLVSLGGAGLGLVGVFNLTWKVVLGLVVSVWALLGSVRWGRGCGA